MQRVSRHDDVLAEAQRGDLTSVDSAVGAALEFFHVQKKKGAKWLKAKTASATISPTGTYSWKYKPAKKGAYRLRATIAKTVAHAAATTKWRTFKVK